MKNGSRNKHGYHKAILEFEINDFGNIQRDYIT